jgi:ABC-type Zn uptake system ZnuABC Zn-binding protein ZnuA
MLALAGCYGVPARSRPLEVVATVLPLADWARQVGGERVRVSLVVPQGVDPRTYEPTSEQQRAIRAADVVLLNGLGLEPWIEEPLNQARHSRMVVLDVSQFTGPRVESAPAEGSDRLREGESLARSRASRSDGPAAPPQIYSRYLWLDPGSAMGQVDLIAQTLMRADPSGLPVYRRNAARYIGELENLDITIHRQLDRWPSTTLLVEDRFLHPFAERYGLFLRPVTGLRSVQRPPAASPLFHDALQLERSTRTPPEYRDVSLNPLAGQTYVQLMQTLVQTMTEALDSRNE